MYAAKLPRPHFGKKAARRVDGESVTWVASTLTGRANALCSWTETGVLPMPSSPAEAERMMPTGKTKATRKLVAKSPEPADQEKGEATAELALRPSVHGAAVAHEYMRAPSRELDLGALVDSLELGIHELWAGDMKHADAMLYGQAHALQAMFTTLALRANSQECIKHSETYLRLALKAQSQCRATLETLATIKAGPVVIARQANIAHGPQQVNNGVAENNARAGELTDPTSELLEI